MINISSSIEILIGDIQLNMHESIDNSLDFKFKTLTFIPISDETYFLIT